MCNKISGSSAASRTILMFVVCCSVRMPVKAQLGNRMPVNHLQLVLVKSSASRNQ